MTGPYDIVRPLGRGGYGCTVLARHKLLGTPACLKWAVDAASRPSLWQEARVLWEVHHPSLVAVRDLWEDPDLGPVVAMRFVAGDTLDAQPPRNEQQVLRLLGRLLKALRCLHHRGIVHNDIKPDNILLEAEGLNPVLVDFGVACSRPRAEARVGGFTPLFVAPELLAGAPPSPQSDLYSLGLTFLHWLGADVGRRELPTGLSRELRQTLLGLCRREPSRRQDPLEFVRRLLTPSCRRTPESPHRELSESL